MRPTANSRRAILLLILTPFAAGEPGVAAPADDLKENASGAIEPRLEEAIRLAVTFEYGKDGAPLDLIERALLSASTEPARRASLEERILGALRETKSRDAREFFCRQLRAIGTARSVSQLETMLRDPELSSLARLALERIDDASAGAALRGALSGAPVSVQAGILHSLGSRRDVAAIPEVAKRLHAPQETLARAAASALGAIGGEASVAALESIRGSATEALRVEIDDALFRCAEQLARDGQNDRAARLFEAFLAPDRPRHQRIGALRGLAAAGGPAAVDRVEAGLRDADPEIRSSAVEACRTVRGVPGKSEETTRRLAGLLTALTPDTQPLFVRALGARDGDEARAVVLAAVKSPREEVRVAAIETLGEIGGAHDVETLLGVASGAIPAGELSVRAARASLRQLRGDEPGSRAVDDAIARTASAPGDARTRVEGIRALSARHASTAFDRLLSLAGDGDPVVRAETIRALGSLAGDRELPSLLTLLLKTRNTEDGGALEQSIEEAFRHVPDREKQSAALLSALPSAPPDAKPGLLRLLGKVPTRSSLEAVRASLVGEDTVSRAAALKALASWPDATPSEELFRLASSLTDPSGREIALRGFVRMAGLAKELSIDAHRRAFTIASRAPERAIVIEGLGTMASTEALDLVEPFLKNADLSLSAPAARAMVAISDRIRGTDSPRARSALESVLAVSQDDETRKRAQGVIEQIEKYQGHILQWMVSGPYREDGKDAQGIFELAFLPETAGAKEAAWKRLRRGVGSWEIDLATALGPADNVAAYVRTTIESPLERDVSLELGSDDGIRAWVNDALVHSKLTARSVQVADDRVKVHLRQGRNELLLKVVNQAGNWGFSCRLRADDGSALKDLKVDPR